MDAGVKTALIIGGAAVGTYLVLKSLFPPVPRASSASLGSTGVPVLVQGLASGLESLFARQSSSSAGAGGTAPSVIDTSRGFYVTPAEARNIADYDAQGTKDNPVYGIAGLDY